MKLYIEPLFSLNIHFLNIAEIGINKIEQNNHHIWSVTDNKKTVKIKLLR